MLGFQKAPRYWGVHGYPLTLILSEAVSFSEVEMDAFWTALPQINTFMDVSSLKQTLSWTFPSSSIDRRWQESKKNTLQLGGW